MKSIEQSAIDIIDEEKEESLTGSVKDIVKAELNEHEIALAERWKEKFNSNWRSKKNKKNRLASNQRKLNAKKNKKRR